MFLREAGLTAYLETATDDQAARLVGVSSTTFYLWRRQEGLPSRQAFRYLEFLEAYYSTRSDGAAAARLGIKREQFWSWRAGNGLPDARHGRPPTPPDLVAEARRLLLPLWSPRQPQPPPNRCPPEVALERYRAWMETDSYRDMGKRVGRFPTVVQKWCVERGLGTQASFIGGGHARWMKAYHDHEDDVAAARFLCKDPRMFALWRLRVGLPPKGADATPEEALPLLAAAKPAAHASPARAVCA